MTTALQIITGAGRLLQVIRKGEAMAADEAMEGLTALNEMIGSWGNNALLVPSRVTETFSVSAATSYTIGSGGTLNTTRPTKIISAYFTSGGLDYPMEYISEEEYANITLKTITSPFPQFYTYTNAYPLGTIKVYPSLGSSAILNLLSEKPLTAFALLSTDASLPLGWIRALRYNLAMELAPEYGKEPSAAVIAIATQSKQAISLAIAKNKPIKFIPNSTSGWGSIYDGWLR
jgi:hypothetical protein